MVYINNHTSKKVNTLLTQIDPLKIGSVRSPAKGRRQVAPGPRGSPTLGAWWAWRMLAQLSKGASLGLFLLVIPEINFVHGK